MEELQSNRPSWQRFRNLWQVCTCVAAGAAVVMMLSYELALGWATPRYGQALEGQQQSRQTVADLTEQLATAREQLAIHRREAQVLRAANQKLVSDQAEARREKSELQAELAFFQSLTAASARGTGLTIHSIRFDPTASDRVFRFEASLTRNLQQAQSMQGQLSLSLSGTQGDKPLDLAWEALGNESTLDFELKYFQQVEGTVILPEGFQPDEVQVTADPAGRNNTVEARFDWQTVLR